MVSHDSIYGVDAAHPPLSIVGNYREILEVDSHNVHYVQNAGEGDSDEAMLTAVFALLLVTAFITMIIFCLSLKVLMSSSDKTGSAPLPDRS